MNKRILVDMDGVLVNIYSRFFELHEKETGQLNSTKHKKSQLVGRNRKASYSLITFLTKLLSAVFIFIRYKPGE